MLITTIMLWTIIQVLRYMCKTLMVALTIWLRVDDKLGHEPHDVKDIQWPKIRSAANYTMTGAKALHGPVYCPYVSVTSLDINLAMRTTVLRWFYTFLV